MLPTEASEKESDYQRYIYLFYGEPKIGKTTTAANFGEQKSDVLFFATEPGHKKVKVFKWKNSKGEEPQDWLDFLECCRELKEENHSFKCLVVDTMDILWRWCGDHISEQHGLEHESDGDYGKIYTLISNAIRHEFNTLGQLGMGFILMSHEQKQTTTYRDGPLELEKEVTDNTLPNSAKKFVKGFCDYIWYFTKNSEGKRYVLTEGENDIVAGSRGDLLCPPLPKKIGMKAETLIRELKKQEGLV